MCNRCYWALRVVLTFSLALCCFPACWMTTSLDQYDEVPAGGTDAGSDAEDGSTDAAVDADVDGGDAADAPASRLSIDPETYDFGSVDLGSPSAPRVFVVTNAQGGVPVGPLSVDMTEDLSFVPVVDGCGGKVLEADEFCSIEVVFAPEQPGPHAAPLNLLVGHDVRASASLQGVGVPVADLAITPSVYDFDDTGVGTGSPAAAFVVENKGSAVSAPLSVDLAGQDASDFSVVTNDCESESLGPGDTCTFSVRFEPGSLGNKSANAVASAGSMSATAQLSGEAVATVALELTPSSWDFGTLEPFGMSSPTTFTLTNVGVLSSGLITMEILGTDADDFAVLVDDCMGLALGPSESCTLEVVFFPDLEGAKSAVLTASDGNEEAEASLAGFSGVPVLKASPAFVSFPDTAAGGSSVPVTITVSNVGPGVAYDVEIALGGTDPFSFEISGDACSGQTLAASETCTVDVVFAPTDPGSFDAILRAGSGSHSAVVNLSGDGLQPASLALEPALYDFGIVGVGLTSAPLALTVSNTGQAASGPLTFDTAGPFSMISLCNANGIPGGTSCDVEVRFEPVSEGSVNGALTVSNGASQAAAAFEGTGTNDPILTIVPKSAQFPVTEVGNTSAAVDFVVTNYGSKATGTLSSQVGAPSKFVVTADSCSGNTLDSLQSCSVSVVFEPDTLGIHTTNLTMSATPGGTVHAALSGNAANPTELTLSPSATNFGALAINSTATAGVVLQNTGGSTSGTVTLDLSPAGAFSIVSDPCTGTTLAPNETCSMLVEFHPTSYGIHQAILSAAETGGATSQASLRGLTADVFVNQVTGNDAFNGYSPVFAKKTITAGLYAAGTGWTVHVAEGTYGTGESFPLSPPEASTVFVENGTVVVSPTGGNAGSVFEISNTDVVLRGFTLRPGALQQSPKLVDVQARRTTLVDLVMECSGTFCVGLNAEEDDMSVENLSVAFLSPDTSGAGISMGRSNSTFDTVSITCMAAPGGKTQNGVSIWDYGAVSFTNLTVTSCTEGMYLAECEVSVRDSVIAGSLDYGIVAYVALYTGVPIDLGTQSDPGNNLIQSDQGLGLALNLWSNEDVTVPAHGNTWRPGVQGADASGEYAPQTVTGPVPEVDGNNYAITHQAGTGVASIAF